MESTPNPEAFQSALRRRVRGDVACDAMTRGIYATDASIYQVPPVAVVCPLDDADARAAVETAAEHGVGVTCRGGGTSLGGQAVGEGLVTDFSKHMNNLLELNVEERWVRVEPGIVRDNLNAELAPHGLHFGPDPATTSRATVGGMIGNNSSGTRSLVYGKTVDNVIETRVLLSNGEIVELKTLATEGILLRRFRKIVDDNRDEIERRFPKTMRRVSGYNLDEFIHTDEWNLAKLIVGSEGTLGVVLDAKLHLEPLPTHTGLCVVHFAELLEAIRAVEPILTHAPSAVEIMDEAVIGLARRNLSIAPLCDFIEGDPAAVLIVEFFGETADEVQAGQKRLIQDLRGRSAGYAYPIRNDAAGKARVWAVRKHGLGLMLGMKGDRKPLAFIEDACVPIPHLPDYIDRLQALCRDNDTQLAMYAHAGVGVIHVRPILDLRRADDIERMKTIAEGAFEMVKEYGGAWCGEHGDGRVRSPFIEPFFGERIYEAFRQVKRLFDTAGVM